MKIAVSSSGRQRAASSIAGERGDDGAHLVRRRDVDADLELAVAAALDARVLAAAGGPQRAHDVLRHEAALLRVGNERAEQAAGLAHHHRRAAIGRQPVLEAAHQRHGQLREPQRARASATMRRSTCWR